MFVGQTRFSLFVPSSGSWRASNGRNFDSAEDYKSYLYHDKRLSLRAEIFLKHTVPTLQAAAKGHEVVHFVSYSESLPGPFKKMLHRAADEYSVLRLDEHPDGDPAWGVPQRYIEQTGIDDVVGIYRLDDDDILSVGFFDVAQQYLREEFVGQFLSLPLGIEAVYSAGNFTNFRLAHVPMNSMGLLAICRAQPGNRVTQPKGGPHDKTDRFSPVILDGRSLGYLRCLHAGQDNAMRFNGISVMERLIEGTGKFPMYSSFDELEREFPTVAGTIAEGNRETTQILLNSAVEDGKAFLLSTPSKDLSVVIEGRSDGHDDADIFVGLLITDSKGRRLPVYKRIDGLEVNSDPMLGYGHYLSPELGQRKYIVSVHLENGQSVSGIWIRGRDGLASPFIIQSLVFFAPGAVIRQVSNAEYREYIAVSGTDLAAMAWEQARVRQEKIVFLIRRVFGQELGNRLIAGLARVERYLRR